jgi:hypothetical protein
LHFKIDHIPGRIKKSLPEFAPWGLGHLTMQTDLSPFHLQQYQVGVAEQKIGVEGVEVEDDLQPALSVGDQEVAVVVKVVQAMT